MSKKLRKPEKDKINIFDEMSESRKKAIEISKKFIHTKPVKFLNKNI